MINQIKNIKEKVKQLLIDKPWLRDSDEKLIANVWCYQMGLDENGISISKSTTAYDFLKAYSENQFSSAETCRRCRQLIQEKHPELRGKSYIARKTNAKKVKQLIHTI